MTNMHKTFAIASVIATMGAGVLGVGTVFAAQRPNDSEHSMANLVNAIAQKFHLAPGDVQAVFDEQRQQMRAEEREEPEAHSRPSLAQAVKDGKLTQAQADMITAKQAEMKTFLASLQGKTPVERQTALKTNMDSLKQWAKDNGIPEQYLRPGRGGMMPREEMGRGMRGRGRPMHSFNKKGS